MNDTVLKLNVVKCLIENFGVVQTERFISLMIKEPFDYTVWQRDLYKDMTVEELFAAASAWKETNKEVS
ncbi:MAG: hypothetical protein FWB75_09640 [Oscillospiraceae bacterium]|nr:hypothetical protein [Oscillospiraceae bacterium]